MRHLTLLLAILSGLACDRSPEVQVERESIITGLSNPIAIHFAPDGSLVIAEKQGRLLRQSPPIGGGVPELFLQLDAVLTEGERGLLDFAFDPHFDTNAFVYTYYSSATTGCFRISRWQAISGILEPTAEQVIWEDPEPAQGTIHFGGSLAFGPDGLLYFTTGDEDDETQPHDLRRAGGKVLRLHPDGRVPTDNPFADGDGPNLDAIWAIGLRNPFRASWDPVERQLWIGEVGGNNQMTAWEDIHIARPGADFGYPPCTGPCNDPLLDSCDCDSHSAPVFSYPHAGAGAAVIGGFVWRGDQIPELEGAYIFGDYVRGWVKFIRPNPRRGSDARAITLLEDAGMVVSLAPGLDGWIYCAGLEGSIWRFRPIAAATRH